MVYIHADESCLGVQFTDRDSPGGAGGLIETFRKGLWVRRDFWISEPATTNNRMALRSAIEAVSALKAHPRVIFVSDSQYLVKGVREWLPAWIARGWKRKSGVLENEALWRKLAGVIMHHDIDWRWVRGHAGHARNEYANHLATRAARDQTQSPDLVPSRFEEWLEDQRDRYNKYFDFYESAPPDPAETFAPAPRVRP